MKEADIFADETELSESRKIMLLKSDRTTNVVYRVGGISKEQAVQISSIETVDKMRWKAQLF